MRNLKKLLAVIVTIAMLATFAIPAFAADTISADAQVCADLGILKGDTANGVTATYLAQGTTRIQAAILQLRMLGREQEALAYAGTANFADASQVAWAGGRAVLGYLKANPSIGWLGIGDNKFDPNTTISAQQMYKVMLESLGYVQGTDFDWATVTTFAASKGLTKVAGIAALNNDNTATALLEGLKLTTKDGASTLAVKLVDGNLLNKDAAIAAGLYSGVTTATVAATGAKKLTVTFSQAVDPAKAVITVKKGTIAVNTDSIVFAADNKSAVITTTTTLSKGDYTVTVSGLTAVITATATAADVKMSKINILSETAPIDSTDANKAFVAYEVLNQYSEKMTAYPAITWTVSTGGGATTPSAGMLRIANAVSVNFIPGATVYLTGVEATSGTVVNDQVTIGLASQESEVLFKGVWEIAAQKLVNLPAGFLNAKYVLLYEVKDQYGNKIATPTFANILFTTNNPLFVAAPATAAGTVTIDSVVYQAVDLVAGTSVNNGGSVTIQAISKLTGKTAAYSITAEALPSLKTFTMSAPAAIVAEAETIEIPFSAIDQYGNAVTKHTSLNGLASLTLSASSGTLAFVAQNDGSTKLMYTAPAAGASDNIDLTVSITSLVSTSGSYSSQVLSVKEQARAASIVGMDAEKALSIAKNNSVKIYATDLIIQDQYGRIMKDAAVTTWIGAPGAANGIVVESTVGATTPFQVLLNGAGADTASLTIPGADYVSIAAISTSTVTTEAIVFTLTTDNAGTVKVTDSAKSFTYTRVAQSEYASYEVKDIGTMYNDGVAGTATPAAYNKALTVYGVLTNGVKVVLPVSDYTVSVSATQLDATTTPGTIMDVAAGGYTTAANFTDAATGLNTKTVTANVIVTVVDQTSLSALAILQKDLVISNVAPKATTIATDVAGTTVVVDGAATINPAAGAISAANMLNFISTVKDQYGVLYLEEGVAGASIATDALTITISDLVKTTNSTFAVAANGTATANITSAQLGDKFKATYKWGTATISINFTVGV